MKLMVAQHQQGLTGISQGNPEGPDYCPLCSTEGKCGVCLDRYLLENADVVK